MKLRLRIPASFLAGMYADLGRTHAHAAERVGFLFARPEVSTGQSSLALAVDYWPVPDDNYLSDELVGAKISDSAIRSAMQRAYDTQNSAFHVHLHDWSGKPVFSRTDCIESARLMRCFCAVAQGIAHGAIILSKDSVCGRFWTSTTDRRAGSPLSGISIIGFPMQLHIP